MALLIRALEIYKVNYGDFNKTTINLLASICILFKEYGMVETSLPWLAHYVECTTAFYGHTVETADACWLYAQLLKMSEDIESSKNHLNRAIAIFEEKLGADDHKTISAQAYLEAVDTLPTAVR